jgi:hypothetical protein
MSGTRSAAPRADASVVPDPVAVPSSRSGRSCVGRSCDAHHWCARGTVRLSPARCADETAFLLVESPPRSRHGRQSINYKIAIQSYMSKFCDRFQGRGRGAVLLLRFGLSILPVFRLPRRFASRPGGRVAPRQQHVQVVFSVHDAQCTQNQKKYVSWRAFFCPSNTATT